MKMLNLVVGELKANCYILYEDGKCIIIDPGAEEDNIIKTLEKKKLTPVAILLTHNHFDHTGASRILHDMYKIPIYDYKNLFEEEISIPPFRFYTIYTPGHSNSSVTYYFKDYDIMFPGDFIFFETIGRVDLPGGSFPDMINSIDKIKKYPNETILYPGHGKETTLGHEKEYNQYFR